MTALIVTALMTMTNFFLLAASVPDVADMPSLLHGWRDDSLEFLRHDVPKIALVLLGSFVLIRLLRIVTSKITSLHTRKLPSSARARQVRTLASVITSVGVFVIVFIAAITLLPLLGLNLGPVLASAGIVGLAIGFGAQSLVHDFINGFYILLENQYDIGDSVRIAGVKGAVEDMSLRRTVLRDDDGTLHTVPNSEIKIVSNMTRDWSQFTLHITTAYGEPTDKVVALLQQVGQEVRHDPAYADDMVSDIEVPGIERVSNGEVEYLMLVKTRPNKQYGVSRELRRRIKDVFQQNNIQAAGPGRVYVVDQGPAA
jgi:moderate conductance mechanosensitive channel